MTWTTIRDRVELDLSDVTLSGVLAYNPARASLIIADHETGEAEVLTVDLTVYGYVAFPGEFFVKGWSEHSGLAIALEVAGVARIVETVLVSPFDSPAHRMRLVGGEISGGYSLEGAPEDDDPPFG